MLMNIKNIIVQVLKIMHLLKDKKWPQIEGDNLTHCQPLGRGRELVKAFLFIF